MSDGLVASVEKTVPVGDKAPCPLSAYDVVTSLEGDAKLTEVAATDGWISSVSDGSVARDGSANLSADALNVEPGLSTEASALTELASMFAAASMSAGMSGSLKGVRAPGSPLSSAIVTLPKPLVREGWL